MKKFILLTLVLLSQAIFAREEVLATITNDENKDVYKIVAASEDVNGDIKTFYKDTFSGATRTTRTVLETALLARNGLILEQRGDYKVIALKSFNFDRIQGGIITIDTLVNGAKGERKGYDISIAKDKTGWRLFKGNSVITKMHLETNKVMLLGTVGIKNVKMD